MMFYATTFMEGVDFERAFTDAMRLYGHEFAEKLREAIGWVFADTIGSGTILQRLGEDPSPVGAPTARILPIPLRVSRGWPSIYLERWKIDLVVSHRLSGYR